LKLPNVQFTSVVYMPSIDLQRIFRDLANFADTVSITSTSEKLTFSVSGESAHVERIFHKAQQTRGGLDLRHDDSQDTVVEGRFLLKYCKLFAKSSAVSDYVEIYLRNDFPLILKYKIASLGELHFCLAPKTAQGDERPAKRGRPAQDANEEDA
tara:strand:- start:337 stop:798 length:462 start_codon:yes stop_codon:yes gene_type:complete